MNQFAIELPALLTASLTLALSAAVAWLALAWLRPAGHRIYRLVWLAVLINGIMLARIPIDLPVLDAESSSNMAGIFGEPVVVKETFDSPQGVESAPEISSSTQRSTQLETGQWPVTSQTVSPGVVPAHRHSLNLFSWLGWIWMFGFVVAVSYLSFNYIRFLIQVLSAREAPPDWTRQCRQLCEVTGLRRPVSLIVHERLGPALILTPIGYRLIVPQRLWSQMSGGQRAAVLRHEIEHYRRGDILTSLFAFVVASIHWFNPFAWMAVCKLNLAAEWACDSAAASTRTERSHFARALLSICTANTNDLVGVHGIGSSDLKLRIQRILGQSTTNTRWGGAALTTLAMIIVLSGWINLRLITASSLAATNHVATIRDEAELESNIKALAQQLSRDGELNRKFYELTQSPTGLIAIGNSVTDVENEMRNEASQQVVPEFFETQVDDQFHRHFAQEVAEAQTDIASLRSALSEIRDQHTGQTDADKLFRRFIESENAAAVLYFSELRKQMRPGQQVLMQHLGRFLAKRTDGKLIVRESAKAPLMEKLKRYESADEHTEFLRSELHLLAEELLEKDELHRKLKQRLRSSRGVGFVLAMALDGEMPLADRITHYLQELDHFFADAPDGLVINEEARDHLVDAMAEMDGHVARMEMLREPILAIVNEIDDANGEAERTVKKFLQTETGLAALSMRIDVDPTGIAGIAEKIKAEIFQETDSGWVVREDRQEEISQFSREMLRANRNLRRQLRMVDNRTATVDRAKIGKLLDSTESKLMLLEKVKEFTEQRRFDAWPIWLQQHFQMVAGKYHVRPEAEELVNHLMQESKEIQRELANDDFQ